VLESEARSGGAMPRGRPGLVSVTLAEVEVHCAQPADKERSSVRSLICSMWRILITKQRRRYAMSRRMFSGMRTISLVALVVQACWSSDALAQGAPITNGDFEGPTVKPWEGFNNDLPAGCSRAHRVLEGNPGKCAKMGKNAQGNPGCSLTGIQQEFSCFVPNTANDWCTVTFQANYPAGAAGEIPEVELWNSLGASTKGIPPMPGWQTYSISIPICSMACRISFALSSLGPGTTTTLLIDNVSNECTLADRTSSALTVVAGPTIPNAVADLEDGVPHGIPALTEWALVILAVGLISAGWYVTGRRDREAA
jgi:hypothetical protein